MKKILLSFFLLVAMVCTNKLKAQCDLAFSNLVITPAGGPNIISSTKCEYFFNASFDISTNSGFKYLFFHSWLAADYPSPSIFNCSNSNSVNPGTSTQLGTAVDQVGKSFLDIGFLNLNSITFPTGTPINVTANFATTYLHDATVVLTQPSNSSGLTAIITRTSSSVLNFNVTGIRIVINAPCGSPIIVKTDIWGSNSNAGDPKAQCYLCGLPQSFNDPALTLSKNCLVAPYKYSFSITTGQSTPTVYNYKVFVHDPLNISPDVQVNSGSATLSTGGTATYSQTNTVLPSPYCCIDPWSGWDVRLDVTSPSFSNIVSTGNLNQSCAPLPIKLKSFTATRNQNNVNVKWETAQEQNNKGFEVQRIIGNEGWSTVGFVDTKAKNGNSNSALNYEFNDINTTKGITQYRLRQLDIDNKVAYSPVRAVRGEAQGGRTIVYPNPGSNGKVNVVFEEVTAVRNVSLTDMSGRIIKRWQGITNNTIQIENLNAGIYTLRIVNAETGEQNVQKIVMKNR